MDLIIVSIIEVGWLTCADCPKENGVLAPNALDGLGKAGATEKLILCPDNKQNRMLDFQAKVSFENA